MPEPFFSPLLTTETLEFLENVEFAPCPWCGGQPTVYFGDPGAPYPGGYYGIACENESCPMSEVNVDKKAYAVDELETVKDLVDIWNTRK